MTGSAEANTTETAVVDKLSLSQWYAIVWVVQEKALAAEFSEIMNTVQTCLQRANQKFGVKRASS